VQEIISAESCFILSGRIKLPYDWFATALEGCNIYQMEVEVADDVYVSCRDFLRIDILREEARQQTPCDILGLSSETRPMSSTDSRDKVYAVSSLSGSEYASRILPDYQLPTWVPNWTTFGYNLVIRGFPYSAAAGTSPSIIPTANPRILALRGYIVDRVEELGMKQVELEGLQSTTRKAQLRDWISLGFKATQYDQDSSQELVAVAMALVAGRAPGYQFLASQSQIDQRVREFQGLLYRLSNRDTFDEAPGSYLSTMQTIDISEYLHSMGVAAVLKVFMLSSKGYIGLVPLLAEPGDLICIFLGGQAPFVLRPQGDEWRLIGAASVHGMMNGELLRRDDFTLRNDLELQEFHIC
jgi:hypothetical protein